MQTCAKCDGAFVSAAAQLPSFVEYLMAALEAAQPPLPLDRRVREAIVLAYASLELEHAFVHEAAGEDPILPPASVLDRLKRLKADHEAGRILRKCQFLVPA